MRKGRKPAQAGMEIRQTGLINQQAIRNSRRILRQAKEVMCDVNEKSCQKRMDWHVSV